MRSYAVAPLPPLSYMEAALPGTRAIGGKLAAFHSGPRFSRLSGVAPPFFCSVIGSTLHRSFRSSRPPAPAIGRGVRRACQVARIQRLAAAAAPRARFLTPRSFPLTFSIAVLRFTEQLEEDSKGHMSFREHRESNAMPLLWVTIAPQGVFSPSPPFYFWRNGSVGSGFGPWIFPVLRAAGCGGDDTISKWPWQAEISIQSIKVGSARRLKRGFACHAPPTDLRSSTYQSMLVSVLVCMRGCLSAMVG